MNEIIKEKEKRILKLTEEHKQNMKRQIEEHNHMINFIQNISSVLNQNSSSSVSNSKQISTCMNKCYKIQSDDTKDSSLFENTMNHNSDRILLRRNQLCIELCSKFAGISELNQFKESNCSTPIPKNLNNSSIDQSVDGPKDPIIPILIRGRRIHSNSVTKERWKQFKDMMKRNNASIEKHDKESFQNESLLMSENQISNATLQPVQQTLLRKRSVSSSLCPSFQYENIFLKGVKYASIVRQVEDRNTTLINRTGG